MERTPDAPTGLLTLHLWPVVGLRHQPRLPARHPPLCRRLAAGRQARKGRRWTRWWTRFDDRCWTRRSPPPNNTARTCATAVALRWTGARARPASPRPTYCASLNASAGAAAPNSTVGSATCAQPTDCGRQTSRRHALSFELDLWGKLRHANEAAQTSLLSKANRDAVRLTLLAQVAQELFQPARAG